MGVVMLVRYSFGWGGCPERSEGHSSSLELLEGRYARGEINRDEYLQKKRDILGQTAISAELVRRSSHCCNPCTVDWGGSVFDEVVWRATDELLRSALLTN